MHPPSEPLFETLGEPLSGPNPLGNLDLADLVPAELGPYLPAITEALSGFLARLPSERQAAIALRQASLPETATAEDRLLVVLHECPTLHKLGQVVARDRRLAPALRARLERLESLPPELPSAVVGEELRRELAAHGAGPDTDSDPSTELKLEIAAQPLAEGSVAVVIPFRWSDGGEPIEGVFKLLKPGVEERLEQELAIWSELGELLDRACRRLALPPIDYRDTFETVIGLLLNEVDFRGEQRNLGEAGRFYADRAGVEIPELLPFSTPRLTAMTRIAGPPVTALSHASASERWRLAQRIAQALIVEPVFAPESRPVFHADPHAGNLLAAGPGRVGIIDWALIGHLTRPVRQRLAQLVLAAARLDAPGVARSLAALSETAVDEDRLRGAIDRGLRRLRGRLFRGGSSILSLLDEAAIAGAIRFPPDLVLFRKGLLTLRGVLTDTSRVFWLDRLLVTAALGELVSELPRRLTSPLKSRDFATHLSNADLLSLAAAGPAAMLNFWRGTLRDLRGGGAVSGS